MRLFCKQTNLLYTSQIRDAISEDILPDLTITLEIFDPEGTSLATGTFTYYSNGVYTIVLPKIDALVDKDKNQIEISVISEGNTIWYFKGPIKSIVRSQL